MPDSPTPKIGPFELLETVSQAALGGVYKALDTRTGQTVALKVPSSRHKANAPALERYLQDAANASSLEHPNISRVLEVRRDGDEIYVVNQWVEGLSLAALLKQRRLTMQEAFYIVKEICKALTYAHGRGVLHRNLEPSNVLLSTDLRTVKVSDFGAARVESARIEVGTMSTGQLSLGTLNYLAPEVANGNKNVDARADIFSLGALLYEMLTGRAPSGRINLPSQVNPALSTEIDPVVLRCLAEKPEQRYGSLTELVASLDRLEETHRLRLLNEIKGLSNTTRKLFGPDSAGKSRLPLLLGGGVALLALLGALAYFALSGGKDEQAKPAPAQPTREEKPAQAEPTSTDAQSSKPSTVPEPVKTDPTPTSAEPEKPSSPAPTTNSTRAKSDRPSATPPAPRQESAPEAKTPAEPAAPAVDAAAAELDVIEGLIDHKAYDQAETRLRAFTDANAGSPLLARAGLDLGRILEARGKAEAAAEKYIEVAKRFPQSREAPEALYRHAQLTLRSRDRNAAEEARSLLGELAERYPQSPRAAWALLQKGKIEEDKRIRQRDAALNLSSAPAALATYRSLSERYPSAPESETALWKLGEIYDDLKLYDRAATAYSELGARFPRTGFDCWFRAGELYEKKLKDAARAVEAYSKVPAASSSYREAQSRLSKLGR